MFLKHANVPHMLLKTPSHWHHNAPDFNPIYDVRADPHQQQVIRVPDLERQLESKMKESLIDFDAPTCQYDRMGL